jgi:hypothetical protein
MAAISCSVGVIICSDVGSGSNSLNLPHQCLSIVKNAEFLLRPVSSERKSCSRQIFLLQV